MKRSQSGSLLIVGVVVVLVLTAVGSGLYVWSQQDNSELTSTEQTSQLNDGQSSESIEQEVEAESSPTDSTLITNVQLDLREPGDESQLPDITPPSFVAYMKSKLEAFECDFTEFPEGRISIQKISNRLVRGGVGCGGGAAITWFLKDGQWQEFGYQSIPRCTTLIEYDITEEFIEQCFDDRVTGQVVSGTEISNPVGPLKKP